MLEVVHFNKTLLYAWEYLVLNSPVEEPNLVDAAIKKFVHSNVM